jgi:hypothetical protein
VLGARLDAKKRLDKVTWCAYSLNMKRSIHKVMCRAVWAKLDGFPSKIPAWQLPSGWLLSWNDHHLIDAKTLDWWPMDEAEETHKPIAMNPDPDYHITFTDADKIRAHSWGVAL